jgi:hypothetical protein
MSMNDEEQKAVLHDLDDDQADGHRRGQRMTRFNPPTGCPVCDDSLILTGLGCESCGTELTGRFQTCEYCSLDPLHRDMLQVFLVSRGNMKDLARHLDVSYPTARARFDKLLDRMGLTPLADDRTMTPLEAPALGHLSGEDTKAGQRVP